jgi:hypothetical protein
MKQTIGRVLHSDGTVSIVLPANGKKFELAELQKIVGGLIEHVFLKPGNGRGTAWINEEGKFSGLPVNPAATRIVNLFDGDYIVGDMVIVEKSCLSCAMLKAYGKD